MKEINLVNSDKKVIIDDEDCEWILSFRNIRLHSTKKYTSVNKKLLHRLIWQKHYGKIKNNIDGNELNL